MRRPLAVRLAAERRALDQLTAALADAGLTMRWHGLQRVIRVGPTVVRGYDPVAVARDALALHAARRHAQRAQRRAA